MKNTVHYYRQGQPLNTEAVVELAEGLKNAPEAIEGLTEFKKVIDEDLTSLSYTLNKSDMVLGFGETMKGLNKRGSELVSFCADEPEHLPSKRSLYGAHNFFVILGERVVGYFIDFPGQITYDVGFSHKDVFDIKIKGCDFDLYKIESPTLKGVVHEFLKIIGESYVPPKWGFGYQQCRWSYETADEIREVARKMRAAHIPCDTIYLDIDYMERFKDFTLCDEKFPDFQAFVEEMKAMDFRLIPIIDAGVKIEKDYDVYEEGVKKDYFCLDKDGKPFVAAVWPGLVHFPDFLNQEARQWFGRKYEVLTRLGIEGFWNDMNEPAIFYTPERLKAFYDHVEDSKEKPLDIYSFFELTGQVQGLANNMEDYKSFYHRLDGDLVRHDKVHNLYGYNMTRSASEGLTSIDPEKRFLLFSRASYVGMHRYGGIWMGDNSSWWEHIELTMKMLPAVNMCGFMYTGCDTGGFQSDADSEMMVRWNQLSLFTPLYRNHAALGSRYQEPYAFDQETTATLRSLIELRYALVPYLYSSYMQAVKSRMPYSMNLLMDYTDDQRVKEIEDQLLIGESLMISPIYRPNKRGRMVYLPEDMLLWTSRGTELNDLKVLNSGDHYVDLELEALALFIRKDKGIVLGNVAQTVEAIDAESMTFVGFLCDGIRETVYDDDGLSTKFKDEVGYETLVTVARDGDQVYGQVEFCDTHGLMKMNIVVVDEKGIRYEGLVDRQMPAVSLKKVSQNDK
jgi:alpha-glucosidase